MSSEIEKYIWQSYNSTAGRKKPPLPARTLSPISKEEWDAMSPKAKWDSIVALRGPDYTKGQALKYFTTSVIRHRLSGVMRVGGVVNSEYPFVVLPSDGGTDLEKFCLTHFIGHVQEAAIWLKIPALYTSQTHWEEILKAKGSAHQIAAEIIAADPIWSEVWKKTKEAS